MITDVFIALLMMYITIPHGLKIKTIDEKIPHYEVS